MTPSTTGFGPSTTSWRAATRARRGSHALMVFLGWPLASFVGTMVAAREIPYAHLSWAQSAGAALAGLALQAVDFLVVGLLAWWVSAGFWGLVEARGWLSPDRSRGRTLSEPALLAAAVFLGTGFWFPGALRHPLLMPLYSRPVILGVVVVLTALALGARLVFRPGRQGRGLALLLGLGVVVPWPAAEGGLSWRPRADEPPLVLLGLDSLSAVDPLEPLRALAQRSQGVWYQRAVSPGLITNAVWTSLLLDQPVREHGVFFAGQSWPRPGVRAPLLAAATAAGYHTISVIPDQSSCGVGTTAGFDEDRSGPLGWRQLVVPLAANSSVLLPLVRPLLPRLPGSPAPANHGGTFSYDLDRELREVFTAGHRGRPTLVAAHTAYLHMEAFPRRAELAREELAAVLTTPLGALQDRSFDWLDTDRPEDPVPLHAWKHHRLLAAVVGAVEETGFLARGGRLALFSDHGERRGLTVDNFALPRYFHVPLVTFGVPARDPAVPTSLLDLDALMGLVPADPPAPAVVEFAMTRPEEWPGLISRIKPRWSGAAEPDPADLAPAFAALRGYQPWVEDGGAAGAAPP